MKQLNQPDLSIVILAYRTGESIVDFVDQVVRHLTQSEVDDYEIVLVANYDRGGPPDQTPKVAKRIAKMNSKIRSLTSPKEGMMGWDARQGLLASRGRVVSLIDGDGQMPPEDIVRTYKLFDSGEYQFVKTYRVSREDGFFRLLASRGFNLVFRVFFPKCQFRDINSKPKLLTRDALAQMSLSCDGWFFDAELILEVIRLRLQCLEIPTHFKNNEWRASFVNFATIFEMLKSMIQYRVRKRKSNE
jgi:glycosyltransferase involved in cell wall biosynthesis